ncbi:MAG: hypothetical protein ACRC2T_09110 [Thermoguttaceae bacterium]
MIKTPLYTIPVPSTEFFTEAFFYQCCILFDFENENGEAVRTGFDFYLPAAVKKTSERASTIWHSDQVYDILAQVEDSPWVDEVRKNIPDHKKHWKTNHYMIYLDSAGCFEVIAASWALLPEQKGKWSDVFRSMNDFFPEFYSIDNFIQRMRDADSQKMS